MRHVTRIGATAFVLGLAALWSPKADACTAACETCSYVPAAYTSANNGDVALTVNSGDAAGRAMAPIATPLGMTYYHAKILNDTTGQNFTETFWDGSIPPASESTGEESPCSKPMSPFWVQRSYPGTGTNGGRFHEDAVPGVLVENFGTPSCTVPARAEVPYLFNSFLHDDVANTFGGSCEKELTVFCGVPVNDAYTGSGGDRVDYGAQTLFNALNAVFGESYGICMGTIGSTAPEVLSFLGIEGLGCGGVSEAVMCDRVAWQIVNEILYKAYPQEFYGLDACNGAHCGWMNDADGDRNSFTDFLVAGPPQPVTGPYPPPNYYYWPDVNPNGTLIAGDWPPSAALSGMMLGAAKSNDQMTPGNTATGAGGAVIPGGCTGSCNQAPINNVTAWQLPTIRWC